MFIGTILKSLEIEDLVSRRSFSRPCYVARSFIQTVEASTFDNDENKSQDASGITCEGDDKFYEAPEDLVDSIDYQMQSPQILNSEIKSLKAPSFTRIAGLLPDDILQKSKGNMEQTDALDNFVKAQLVIFDQNSPRYSNLDKQVGVANL